jgi:uncharacterized protein (DUF302 family)
VSYLTSITLVQPFEQALDAVRAQLAAQGFGVLTEIDMQSTLKAKLGVDIDPYVILGACNPPLAYRALQAEPSLGVLLPCNLVVRFSSQDTTMVEAVDPATLVTLTDNEELAAVTGEVATRLAAAMDALGPR